jgi:hypothetical protein
MMPFATAVGKIIYAKRVNGACRVKNRTGGITNLKLTQRFRGQQPQKDAEDAPIHRHVVMYTVHQEMQCEERRPIGQPIIDMEQEPVECIL